MLPEGSTLGAVESRMGAVAWDLMPALRLPSPLIKPSAPISGTWLSATLGGALEIAKGERQLRSGLDVGWLLSVAVRRVTILPPDGSEAPGSPVFGHGIVVSWAIAVDGNDHIWIANFSNPPDPFC
jgi:hypothetical protein